MHLLTGTRSADETDTTETIPTTLMLLLQEIAAPNNDGHCTIFTAYGPV